MRDKKAFSRKYNTRAKLCRTLGTVKKKKICSPKSTLDVEDKHKSLHRLRGYMNENIVVFKLIHMGSQELRTALTGTGVPKGQRKK